MAFKRGLTGWAGFKRGVKGIPPRRRGNDSAEYGGFNFKRGLTCWAGFKRGARGIPSRGAPEPRRGVRLDSRDSRDCRAAVKKDIRSGWASGGESKGIRRDGIPGRERDELDARAGAVELQFS